MNRVIFDLEASCWQNPTQEEKSLMETIEIGAVRVDESFNQIDTFQTFIKPIATSQLSPFCKQLTSITQEQVDAGLDFKSAFAAFRKWAYFPHVQFISWGNYDYNQLTKDCQRVQVQMFGKYYHLNGKELYKTYTGKAGEGLGKELKKHNITFEGTQHRGIDDAINIAKLLKFVSGK